MLALCRLHTLERFQSFRALLRIVSASDAERFDNAVRKAFTVSKEEIERREAEWQRTQDNAKQPKKP